MNTSKKSIYPFFETIRVEDGIVCAPERHLERMRATCINNWGHFRHTCIFNELIIPKAFSGVLAKLNIYYNETELEFVFSLYNPRKIETIKLVEVPARFEYHFKYTERSILNNLLNQSGTDEIIIVQQGLITDSSKANIIFEKDGNLFTPESFLLNGTMRQYLLEAGEITEMSIGLEELYQFEAMYFVNAMNPLKNSSKYDCKMIL